MRIRGVSAPAFAACLAATSPLEAQPVVSFATQTATTTEGATVEVLVDISEVPTAAVLVKVRSRSDVAHQNVDYVEVDANVRWSPGDGASKAVAVETLHDDVPEDFEWFDLYIERDYGAELGDPSEMTIYIPNDDGAGAPVAWLGVDDAFQGPDGIFTFEAEAGAEFLIPVRLNQVPNPPLTVDYEVSIPPFSGTLVFNNTDEVILKIEAPFPEDHISVVGDISVSVGARSQAPGERRGGEVTTALLSSYLPPLQGFEQCFFCWWAWIINVRDPFFGTCPIDCWASECCATNARQAGGFDPNAGLFALRRYRDEILSPTSVGQRFIALYDEHAGDAGRALLTDPGLALELVGASQAWVGPLTMLLDGNGDAANVTADMVAALLRVIDRMVAAGSPAFADALTTERERLQLDEAAGLTMSELQAQVEALGDTPVRSTSWAAIKSRYRDRAR